MPGAEVSIRPALASDAEALAAIYGHHVLHGFGTFETAPPTVEEMARRLAAVIADAHPYLVAEREGRVVGLAYAAPFNRRAAYRDTVEDSIYVAPDMAGQGVGRALLSAVVAACEAMGKRQMLAVIGDSANVASIGLHAALGFEPRGVGRSVGFKHGRWLDIVWMQRALNGSDGRDPDVR